MQSRNLSNAGTWSETPATVFDATLWLSVGKRCSFRGASLARAVKSRRIRQDMIGSGSTLQVSDNSGAKIVQCIKPSGKSYSIGDVITVAVKTAGKGKVAAGSVQKAVIVETKKEFKRKDGSQLRFDRNSCVLLGNKGLPIGTRVLGFVTHELRARQMMKVLSLAARVI